MKNISSPFGPPYDVLGGVFEDPDIRFRFEIWSSRRLRPDEMDSAYTAWRRSLRRRTVIKGKTIRIAWTSLD